MAHESPSGRNMENYMAKQKPLPRHCLIVRTYAELRDLVTAFANGAYDLMCILGGPGLGKSETMKRIMQQTSGSHGWGLIKGKHTALDLYERLYRFRSVPVVLDDLDDLLRKPENVMLLKCLCDTTPVKRLEWGSKHSAFKGDLPKSFESISRVCLISNDWNALDRNISALHDRGIVLLFQPSVLEVHRELARSGWFSDEEVFDFIGRILFLVAEPSLRFYKTAVDHKQAGLDWQDLTLRTIESAADPKLILVARLLASPEYDDLPSPEAARVRAFNECGGGTKATYYRYKAELLARRGNLNQSEVSAIKLQPTKPDLMHLALLDRRNQIAQLRDVADDEFSQNCRTGADDTPKDNVDRLARLHEELEQAVAQEDYERAARLRDEIRRMIHDQRDADA